MDEQSDRIDAISSEESRAMSVEALLSDELANETSARQDEDTWLFGELSTEVSNRIADVDAEESRAMSEESRIEGSFNESMNYEITSRSEADNSLAADLSTEESRAMSAEGSIAANLSTELVDRAAAVSTEASTRLAADNSLETKLSNELEKEGDARTSADTSLATSITNEASTRLAADVSLATAVSAEASRIDVILDGSDVDLDQFAEIVDFVNGIDLENDNALLSAMTAFGADLSTEEYRAMGAELVLTNDLSAEVSNRTADVDAEESRATSAEGELQNAITNVENDLDTEISDREVAVSAEESARIEGDASLASDLSTAESARVSADASLSSEIDSLSEVDGATISLDAATNEIRLKETIAAPASGIYTFNSNVEVSGDLTVDGVNVMAEISSEISRAEAAEDSIATELSTQVSYLISNIDVTEIDSFSEIVEDLSTEIVRAESAELSLSDDFANIYFRNAGVVETANGIITEFTFGATLRTGSQAVYLNGILQDAGDYAITTTSVTFDNAPLAGDKVAVYGMY
jgi:hypothetical protein